MDGMWRIGLQRVILPAGLLVAITLVLTGCGVSEPPLPSAPLPIPSVLRAEATATPAATTAAPTSVPTALAIPPTPLAPSGGDGRTLTVSVAASSGNIPDYDRADWRHWIDTDGDCQDARQEVLIAESRSAVVYEAGDQCRVESGDWFGVYTGESFTDPGDLDVDHMVPLANAHRSGGWAWSKERKTDYANDLSYADHLIAVQASANRQKGSKGPEEWKPPRREYWCEYATDWVTIKQDWGLSANPGEAEALREMLATCDEPVTLVVVPVEGDAIPQPAPASATATPVPASDGELRYDPDGPDRNCGDFDTWDEAQAFYIAAGGPATDRHRLDGDGDGEACNSLKGN